MSEFCPKCKTISSWSDGGSTKLVDTVKTESGLVTFYCMKCGYYEQEKHDLDVCGACKGAGFTDSTREVVATGFMTKDELKRRVTEDFMMFRGIDPSRIFDIPQSEWMDPESMTWDEEEEDGSDEGTPN